MFHVYILQSETSNRYYVGMTEDIEKRLSAHNRGANRSTKGRGPWKIVYTERCIDKPSAWKRERQIKSYKGGQAFKKLITPGGVA